jgi:ATP-binding cassette subfamily B protein
MGMHGGGFMHRATVEQESYKIRNLDRAVIRMFIKYLHPYRWKLLLTLTLMIVVAGMNMAAPYVSKIAVDTYIANNDLAGLNLILLAYVIIYGIYWFASYHGSYLSLTVGHRVVADIRKDLYAHVSSLSLDFLLTVRREALCPD